MAARYYTTALGARHWDVLGDPVFLSAKDIERGKALRASMSQRDWALQQVCVQLEVYGDLAKAATMSEMIEAGVYNWTSFVGESDKSLPTPSEQMYYQYYHMEELINELVQKGFVAKVEQIVNNAP